MRDTLHEDDVLKISLEYKTYIYKCLSREDDFSSKFIISCRRAADNDFTAGVKNHGKPRKRIMTRQTNSNYLV